MFRKQIAVIVLFCLMLNIVIPIQLVSNVMYISQEGTANDVDIDYLSDSVTVYGSQQQPLKQASDGDLVVTLDNEIVNIRNLDHTTDSVTVYSQDTFDVDFSYTEDSVTAYTRTIKIMENYPNFEFNGLTSITFESPATEIIISNDSIHDVWVGFDTKPDGTGLATLTYVLKPTEKYSIIGMKPVNTLWLYCPGATATVRISTLRYAW